MSEHDWSIVRTAHRNRLDRVIRHSRTDFTLLGLPEHRARIVILDTIVSSYVHQPLIEVFDDDSLRFYVGRGQRLLLNDVTFENELRGYVFAEDQGYWINLLSPICANCYRVHKEHVREQCLWASTRWESFRVPPVWDFLAGATRRP